METVHIASRIPRAVYLPSTPKCRSYSRVQVNQAVTQGFRKRAKSRQSQGTSPWRLLLSHTAQQKAAYSRCTVGGRRGQAGKGACTDPCGSGGLPWLAARSWRSHLQVQTIHPLSLAFLDESSSSNLFRTVKFSLSLLSPTPSWRGARSSASANLFFHWRGQDASHDGFCSRPFPPGEFAREHG